MKNISKEMEVMEMENGIGQIREDLPGDAMQSAKLVLAAIEKKWSEVETLLEQGADPRICRRGDAYGVESALYFALAEKQWNIAAKLYDAGDRLDDLVTECELPLPWQVLDFLAGEMRRDRNYFLDESKTLSECCRCSAFKQIEKLMPNASQEELDKSIVPTVNAWIRYFRNVDAYLDILKGLKYYGAKLSAEDKTELLAMLERRFGRYCPQALHPGKEQLEKMVNFIKNA